jgi:hypothetical protein
LLFQHTENSSTRNLSSQTMLVFSTRLSRCSVPLREQIPQLALALNQLRWGSTYKKLAEKKIGGNDIELTSTDQNTQSMEDLARSIDTTIAPEKRAHVEALKKAISGGHKSVRSLYREVPTPEELDQLAIQGNFIPKIAPNARELIDFALSHIPEKGGRRGTRKQKRMALKWKIKVANDARRKKETVAALERKHKVLAKQRALIKKYKKEARKLYGSGSGKVVNKKEVAGKVEKKEQIAAKM